MNDAVFELNAQTLVGIGAVLGALAGAVSFLFRALIVSKDNELKALKERLNDTLDDRDFWRDVSLGTVRPGDRDLWEQSRQPQQPQYGRTRNLRRRSAEEQDE